MTRLLGLETEYGLDIDGIEPGQMIAESREVVLCCPQPYFDKWDYAHEDPRRDIRGYRVKRLRRPASEVEYASADPRFRSISEEHADRILPCAARLYNDHGHPEFSTPECVSLQDLVRYDRAGERIVRQCAAFYTQRTGRATRIVKNNTDFHGSSYGSHESYLVTRTIPADTLIAALAPFLATRQIFAGAGKVGHDVRRHRGSSYQISQRAEYIDTVASVDTLTRRALVNTRDEPHADENLYRRLHIIVGDANMSEWATAMKVGSLALVLDALEAGWTPPFTLTDPVAAVRAIAMDPSLGALLPVDAVHRSGSHPSAMSAIEIQRAYRDAAGECSSDLPERDWVLSEWTEALDDLMEDPERCGDRIDWIAKRRMIQLFEEHTDGQADPQGALQSVDLAYHDTDPAEGLYHALEDEGAIRRVVADDAIEQALREPPIATRAFVRGHFVSHHRDRMIAASWSEIAFRSEDGARVFDMSGLVDGSLEPMNRDLAAACSLADTERALRRYRATGTRIEGTKQDQE